MPQEAGQRAESMHADAVSWPMAKQHNLEQRNSSARGPSGRHRPSSALIGLPEGAGWRLFPSAWLSSVQKHPEVQLSTDRSPPPAPLAVPLAALHDAPPHASRCPPPPEAACLPACHTPNLYSGRRGPACFRRRKGQCRALPWARGHSRAAGWGVLPGASDRELGPFSLQVGHIPQLGEVGGGATL